MTLSGFSTFLWLFFLFQHDDCRCGAEWILKYREDFTSLSPSSPLKDDNMRPAWQRETYEVPFDTIMDDAGDFYRNDYGPAFDDALNSFNTYRQEFQFGQDDWLTASLSARDVNKDGNFVQPRLFVDTLSNNQTVLTMEAPGHTGGVILRPTQALPETYRIEYKLTGLDFGGKRNGSIQYQQQDDNETKINGYSSQGCKTQHPWGEGSGSRGWSGDASAPYCEWQSVRDGPYGYNGFHFLTVVDFADPAPRNNHFWHYHRKVLMDSFSVHPDRIDSFGSSQICDASTNEYYDYQESNFVTVNMWVSGKANYNPRPGALTGNSQRFITNCNGKQATRGIQSAGELKSPDEWYNDDGTFYTFAIERNSTGYTMEASGIFERSGYQTFRYYRPFIVDDEPIWHYNVKPSEYDGRYNGDLTQSNWAFGSQTWPDQWPAGSAYPDYFVIGALYTNVYEGKATLTDIRLYHEAPPSTTTTTSPPTPPSDPPSVPPTLTTTEPSPVTLTPTGASSLCSPIVLMERNQQVTEGEPWVLNNDWILVQEPNGNFQVRENPLNGNNLGKIVWETGARGSTTSNMYYYTVLQGDGNLITWQVMTNNDGDNESKFPFWKSNTSFPNNESQEESFYLVLDCDSNGTPNVAIYLGHPDQRGSSVWEAPHSTPTPTNVPTVATEDPSSTSWQLNSGHYVLNILVVSMVATSPYSLG